MELSSFQYEYQVADMFELKRQDLTKRKQSGTILPFIVEWGVNKKVNLHWLLTGEGDAYLVDKGAVSGENPIILIGDIIEGLETVLQEDDSELPPRTMRLVVEQIYKRCRKTGEAVTEDIVRDYLKLVAA